MEVGFDGNTIQLVRDFANELGVTVQTLLPMYADKAFTIGVVNLALTILTLLIGFVVIWYNRADHNWDDFNWTSSLTVVGWIIVFMGFICILCLTEDIMLNLFNSDIQAIKLLTEDISTMVNGVPNSCN